jgi:hypothetical protein
MEWSFYWRIKKDLGLNKLRICFFYSYIFVTLNVNPGLLNIVDGMK